MIPDGWKTVNLGEIVDFLDAKRVPLKKEDRNNSDSLEKQRYPAEDKIQDPEYRRHGGLRRSTLRCRRLQILAW